MSVCVRIGGAQLWRCRERCQSLCTSLWAKADGWKQRGKRSLFLVMVSKSQIFIQIKAVICFLEVAEGGVYVCAALSLVKGEFSAPPRMW